MKNPWKRVDNELANYNKSQYSTMYRSTNFVINSLRSILENNSGLNILDVGCSAGANLYHISREFEYHNFIGIDFNNHFLNEARATYSSLGVKNVTFKQSDFKDYSDNHDIIGSSQVLGVMDFEEAMLFQDFCFEKATKGVYFMSMFSDRHLDFEIYVHDYNFNPKKRVPYCMYSLPKLVEKARIKGYKLITDNKFIIDIDLEDNHTGRGTYTIKKSNNERMMFTDILHMPWKFLYFEKIA